MRKHIFLYLLVLFSSSLSVSAEDILPPIFSHLHKHFTSENGSKMDCFKINIRPLITYKKSIQDGKKIFEEIQFIWPLIHYKANPEEKHFRILPLLFFSARRKASGGYDTDFAFFPFLFFGNDPEEGRYFMLLPFGGRLKGKLGKDIIDVFLFPLFARAVYKDVYTRYFLYPFIKHTSGGGHKGFRILPLFGRHTRRTRDGKEIMFWRNFFLWPFFIWQRNYINTPTPVFTFFSFPLFGYTTSKHLKRVTVLFPFFQYSRNSKHGFKEFRMPYPFVVIANGKNFIRRDFWPLTGFMQKGKNTRMYWLWPLGRLENKITGTGRTTRVWMLPLFWAFHKINTRKHTKDEYVKLWPFMSSWKKENNEREFSILSIWPFREKVGAKGFEENYSPFFHLVHHVYQPGGKHLFSLFFGLLQHRFSRTETRFNLHPFLVEYKRKENEKEFSFLKGFITYHRKDGKKRFTLLWIFRGEIMDKERFYRDFYPQIIKKRPLRYGRSGLLESGIWTIK